VTVRVRLALLCCGFGAVLAAASAHAQQASTSLYVRTDSDRTTVITPRLRVSAPLAEDTTVDVAYTVDVWTSASIDIRTSASKAVTEQRDQIDVGVGQVIGDASVGLGYRYSSELDYESNGGSLAVSYDLADRNTTLALALSAMFDDVGRAGDPGFSRALRTTSARVSLTQVLDSKMFGQLIYELGRSEGYLASAYRFVGIGTMDGACGDQRPAYCVMEQVPNARQRHAASLSLRRALFEDLSLGAGYRFYTDDWDLLSHTVEADLAWLVASETLLRLRYRLYTQTKAVHYSKRFLTLPAAGRYFTHDKELSTFNAHRIGLDLEKRFVLDESGHALRLVGSLGPTFYTYLDFPPLSQITAFEATLSLVLELGE
jgi:hypothetical protein